MAALVEIEAGSPESPWVERQLSRPVVKAFNNIYAQHLLERGRPAGAADRIALPVAGDTPKAKQTVMRLIDELGFDPVDAGRLDESWRQQLAHRFMQQISMPKVCAGFWLKQLQASSSV